MSRYRESRTVQAKGDFSPELALIDVALAEHLRSMLPEPRDTLARVGRLAAGHRDAALEVTYSNAADILGASTTMPMVISADPHPRHHTMHRRSALIAGAVAGGLLGIALLVGVRVEVDGDPAGAVTAGIGQAPPTPTTSQPSAPPSGRKIGTKSASVAPPDPAASTMRRATPRRFAWASVAGATAYHIEFFRGAARVFSGDSSRPKLTIPAGRRRDGPKRSLPPGEYRWYVWSVVSGKRASQAVVQAKLTLR